MGPPPRGSRQRLKRVSLAAVVDRLASRRHAPPRVRRKTLHASASHVVGSNRNRRRHAYRGHPAWLSLSPGEASV